MKVVAWIALVAAAGALGAGLAVDLTGATPHPEDLSLAASSMLYALVGFLVVRRHTRHPVGWLLLSVGILGTVGGASDQITEAVLVDGRGLPAPYWAAWIGDWYWVPWLWGQFVYLPLLFPTGKVPGPRWRAHASISALFTVVSTGIAMFGESLLLSGVQVGARTDEVRMLVDNPVGFLPIENLETTEWQGLLLVVFVLALLSVVSLVARFRRSTGRERDQIKVAVYGLVVTVSGFVLFAFLDVVGSKPPVAQEVLLTLIPMALGVAILRNRLYDIDRVISRTLAYALSTAVLVAVYLGSVVLAQTALRPVTGESDVAVAASTLVAAALFRPVLDRVQTLVDRRFNRRRYDARLTVEAFGHLLRDEVELQALVADLHRTVDDVVEPRHVSVWVPLRGGVTP